VPATLNEIKHNAQIEFSVVHWKEGNEKRRTFGRSDEAEKDFPGARRKNIRARDGRPLPSGMLIGIYFACGKI